MRPRAWLIGTTIGAVLLTLLQSAAGLLMGVFGGNAAAGVFGPIIVMMLVFNLLATIILMTAAWVGTEDVWAAERAKKLVDGASNLTNEVEIDPVDEVGAAKEASRRWAATRSLDDLRRADESVLPQPDAESMVRQDVAARGMRTSMNLGYGVGAATGVGIGVVLAAITRLLKR
ncbi:MAG TPA: hypothetical protein K8V15_01735 [Tessaracoccus flavescens]|uniref:Uncharacterized protein n=1 Tax=Tessaracoccus flavescens TaxID=399497 RepID=A0A921ELD8_9ACTN|nr:hypothetical protein [Tessaracoccus flavescens]